MSHYNRQFRKYTGLTPSQFRNSKEPVIL
ncbi:AraC family transcriptional regulator [Bacteroidota bacterium]